MSGGEDTDALIESLRDALRDVPMPTEELLRRTGISAATLSRALTRDDGRHVLRLGKARATRYARKVAVRAHGASWPLFVVDARGEAREVAMMHRTGERAFVVEHDARSPAWLSSSWGEDTRGERARDARRSSSSGSSSRWSAFDDLPWYLQDVRPQGFLGRAILRRQAASLSLPSDPRVLTSEHTMLLWLAMPALAADLPGQLVVGEGARSALTVPERVTRADYPRIARAAMDGDVAGSSAGGEQAKFTAFVDDGVGARHVIVKFAERSSENGARWADLLVAEHVAGEVLRAHGIETAESALVVDDAWCFLESTRFDRVGARGRRAVCSLAALDASFHGARATTWTEAVRALKARGLVDDETVTRVAVADAFGARIDNADRHLGNASLFVDDDGALSLTPVYDMLPMAHAPDAHGVRPFASSARFVGAESETSDDVRALAARAAAGFFSAIADDGRVSREMRAFARARVSTGV